MRSLTSVFLRFVASLFTAIGLGGLLILGGAWVFPHLVNSADLDLENLPRWIYINATASQVDQALRQEMEILSDIRETKEEIIRQVLRGSLTEAEGRQAFAELTRRDPRLAERLGISMPQLTQEQRIHAHFDHYLHEVRKEWQARGEVF